MKNHIIEKDIPIFYVNATSFPEGVLGAFEKLHEYFPIDSPRHIYGLSRPEDGGKIVYKAAAEMNNPEEAKEYKLDTMIIPKGTYISETVHDFMQNVPEIGKAFERLMKQPGIDKNGYCVEWYLNDQEVLCMIRLE